MEVYDRLLAAFGEPRVTSTYWRFEVRKGVSIYILHSNKNVGYMRQTVVRGFSRDLEAYFQRQNVPLRPGQAGLQVLA